ncbi:hypothetical protein KDW_25480 [Dictyobacter vulcani]|uniref:Uncharacterized protein n=1 Tax=Dictyobacter vulcani TaxID=2607529 RepID=A0A5J4KT33_9CHLR|nr:hypothetical protein [Dictyobacter vulcani]GER88386.1 hypothetical protein KDW_25480 [Dictyobacter vulcani]
MEDFTEDGSKGNYELMYFALLDYRFEKVSFLEMLDMWEMILGIKSSSLCKVEGKKNTTELAS